MMIRRYRGMPAAVLAALAAVSLSGGALAAEDASDVTIRISPPAGMPADNDAPPTPVEPAPPSDDDGAELAEGMAMLGQLPDMLAAMQPGEATTDVAEIQKQSAEIAKAMTGMARNMKAKDDDAKLQRPVDIQLRNAPIRQVAEALSRASGIRVSVSNGVSKEARVNLDARHIPLSTVLEGIARQADLIISREDDGIALGPWPSLTVNGTSTRYRVRNAPWSDDWLIPPTTLLSTPWTLTMPGAGSALSAGPRAAIGLGGAIQSDGGRVSVAAIGDRLVVAEPGANDAGEGGVWLTVYRLAGDNLQQVSQTFQKSKAASGMKIMSFSSDGKYRISPDGAYHGGGGASISFGVKPSVKTTVKPNVSVTEPKPVR